VPIYYVNIDVRFRTKQDLVRESGSVRREAIRGFLCEVGATYPDLATLKSAIEAHLVNKVEATRDSLIVYDHIGIIDIADLCNEVYEDSDIRDALLAEPTTEGIWYSTGCGFYW